MSSSETAIGLERHPRVIRLLHWATVIAIAVAVAAILGRELTEDKLVRRVLLDTHRQLGLLILFALVVRLLYRWRVGLAKVERGLSAPMRTAATVAHSALYIVLAVITMLGWALSSAHAVHLRFLGFLPLPNLVSADSDRADTLTDYHVWAAWGLLWLVLFHVAAALWHHYVRRDGVLVAMLPGKAPALTVAKD